MYLLRLVAPASYQTEIQTYIDKIRAFQATVQECTGKKDRMGSISFMQMVLKLPAVALDTALNCNVFNSLGCTPGNAVRTVVDRLGDLAQGMTGISIPVVRLRSAQPSRQFVQCRWSMLCAPFLIM